jgi:hypothetical protein
VVRSFVEKRFTAKPQRPQRDAKKKESFGGRRIKRNAEAGREQRKTLSWILKVWSADFSRHL